MKNKLNLSLFSIILTFVLSVFVSSYSTDTTIKRTDDKVECSVILENIPKGSVIVVSSLKNNRYSESQLRNVTEKTIEKFFFDKETKEIRVFVFENISSITPITECKKVKVPDIVIDDEWSEWV